MVCYPYIDLSFFRGSPSKLSAKRIRSIFGARVLLLQVNFRSKSSTIALLTAKISTNCYHLQEHISRIIYFHTSRFYALDGISPTGVIPSKKKSSKTEVSNLAELVSKQLREAFNELYKQATHLAIMDWKFDQFSIYKNNFKVS